ncbi:DUF1501 domain-containing protein [Catenovulum sp. SM1970]|uniref:DUF1501 domain-containing protein n=1 Tax=Marinifaba aquimaris TaxID=2741323 RepID=UPI0015734E66|nr:DUF1501 domain-containing protein [Marinifaba aquimaris]NTS75805.1 DUF1501 domain-containing protein [Marinifaba aquimaris]
MNRRHFIKLSSASLLASSFGNMLAHSADADDYKALVCVFLYGGMDNHDTIIPYDQASYQRWAQIRESLLSRFQTPRTNSNLLALNTPSRFAQRRFALPPEMTGLHQLYQQGNMAVVGNVGPLLTPTTQSQIDNDAVNLPARLFSHNDQQSTWMSGSTEGAQFGWAGQIHDALITDGLSSENAFSAVTMSGGELMITGQRTSPYHLIGGQALDVSILEASSSQLSNRLFNHFRATGENYQNLLQQDLVNKQRSAFDANALFQQSVINDEQTQTGFPESSLGEQLKSVHKVIKAKSQLGANRQIFVVTLGGFDTHSDQARELPQLQSELDGGLTAFYQALVADGLSEQVTTFTASDFGRTLAINGDGTDHGWAGHHFVMGGAVNGGNIYGDIPIADFGHELDAGSGRLIPTTSIEQYAANFASWMGLSESRINQLFPTLNTFGPRVNFMR